MSRYCGGRHQRIRAALLPEAYGLPCPLCGRLMSRARRSTWTTPPTGPATAGWLPPTATAPTERGEATPLGAHRGAVCSSVRAHPFDREGGPWTVRSSAGG
jgi:hypothetical protein